MHALDEIILKLFNMSVSASWLVLAVIVLRLLLKKAPKWINCCLWALVGIRLINPFSFESVLSLIPSAETVTSESFYYSDSPTISTGVEAFNSVVNPIITESLAPTAGASVNPTQILGFVLGTVWLIGMAVMFLYVLISFLLLKKAVAVLVNIKDNIYVSDDVQSPFILGIIKPKIYLPSDLDEETQSYVISHEKAHIKRKDYLWKPIGFILLSVYWFNPLMWLAYILLCRDIELACDEKVIRDMQTGDKKAYSEALLSCSTSQRLITACPVAFGEVGVKQRIKGVLNYKKPAFWVIAVALIASVVVGVCFMTDPVDNNSSGKKVVSVYEIDEVGFDMYNTIMGAAKYTVVKDVYTYYDTSFGNGIGKIRELLQMVLLEKLDKDAVDHKVEIQYDGIIKIDNTMSVYFHDDYSKMYLARGNSKYSITSDDYAVNNPELVKDFFENEEYKTEAPVWEYNPLKSTYGYGEVHLYVDEKYAITGFEVSSGVASEIVFEESDEGMNGIKWRPDVSTQDIETQITIHTICDNKKTDFNLTMIKVGADEFASYYMLSAEDTVIAGFGNNYEYMLDFPKTGNSDDNSFTWTCNPMAGGTWWYELTFTLPDGYEIKSAKANGGSVLVDPVVYNEPDGEKCVEWTPDFNRAIDEEEDYTITVTAEKDGEEISLNISVKRFSQNNEDGTKTYIIEPVDCKLSEKGIANYEISPSPIEDLDLAVSQAILTINSNKNWLGVCPAEGHIILGKDEEKDVTKVYVLERFSSFGFENGWFIEVGGHSTACVMTFVSVDGGYVFQDVEYIEDGSHLDDSVKRLFPFRYRKRALNPTDADSKSMDEQCEKYAKAYLDERGREAKIGSYGDVPRIWLTDLGVSTEVSNILLEMKGRTNACEVGYYEQSGEIYRTLYCEEEKIILYTKELYEKGIVEKTAIDATTGKEVPFKNEYLDTAKGYEDYIAEGVKEKVYTTMAVIVE